MPAETSVSTELLQEGCNKTSLGLGQLEGGMQRLANIQGEFQSALKGQVGVAVYNALGNAYETGGKVGEFLNNIIQAMTKAGYKVDTTDMESAALIAAAEGADGTLDVGNASGTWANNLVENVGERDMSKVKLDF